jgi:hypothetical protein
VLRVDDALNLRPRWGSDDDPATVSASAELVEEKSNTVGGGSTTRPFSNCREHGTPAARQPLGRRRAEHAVPDRRFRRMVIAGCRMRSFSMEHGIRTISADSTTGRGTR